MARLRFTLREMIADLKRRGVLPTLGVYLVGAWATIEVASTTFSYLGLSDRAVTAIIVIAGLGVPVVAALAWVFEITPEGVRRTADAEVKLPSCVWVGDASPSPSRPSCSSPAWVAGSERASSGRQRRISEPWRSSPSRSRGTPRS